MTGQNQSATALNLAEVLNISEPERYRVAKHFVADSRFDRSNLHFIGQQSKPFKIWDSGEVTNLLPILITGKNGLFVSNLKIREWTDVGESSAPRKPLPLSVGRGYAILRILRRHSGQKRALQFISTAGPR